MKQKRGGVECPSCGCRFGRDFRNVDWVTSPLVYWGLSTSRVLTLEYLPGIKISDVTALRSAGIDTKLVARRATEAYLIQLLQTSFLHSDVHPGNIGIDRSGEDSCTHTHIWISVMASFITFTLHSLHSPALGCIEVGMIVD